MELLREAGWSSRGGLRGWEALEFTILVRDGFLTDKRVAEYLRLAFNDLGIKVHVETLPRDEVTRRVVGNHQFEAVLTEFLGSRFSESIQSIWSPTPNGPSKAGCFEDPGLTKLLELASREHDPERQQKLLQEADVRIAELQRASFPQSDRGRHLQPHPLTLSFQYGIAGHIQLKACIDQSTIQREPLIPPCRHCTHRVRRVHPAPVFINPLHSTVPVVHCSPVSSVSGLFHGLFTQGVQHG